MYFPNTTWTRLFLAVAVVQCVAATVLEIYVVLTVESKLGPEAAQVMPGHTVPMYAALFIFGFAYELLLFWDSLRLSSMIQVVGLCIYNLLLTLYAIFQPRQIQDALHLLEIALPQGADHTILDPNSHVWEDIQPALLALAAVLAIGTAAMGFIAYKLHSEFAWLVYKVIHADIRMKRRAVTLEVNVALVKFDFFFLFGFLVQNIIRIGYARDPEWGMTAGGTVVVWLVAIAGILFARAEHKPGTTIVIVVYFGGVVYLVYKLVKLMQEPGYLLLTIFGFITLAMLVCTILAAILCFANYGKGLKTYGNNPTALQTHARSPSENPMIMQNTAYGVRPFLPHRMTID
ncbi:hypothetical protein PG996_002724 [Apiospora saccharicola]|uniref:Uncharacterized protein n=1 Tax=Apiospora saccharicola TaxID=335842 RepID=A0ABR1WPL8_9PEZI